MFKRIATVATTLFLLAEAGAAPVDIPLSDATQWSTQQYRNIKPNTVDASPQGLTITVAASASPLVYRLEQPTRITGVRVEANWSGNLDFPEGVTQGDEGADDFVLKLGLVEAGDKTLNWLQRRVAADWIRELYELAPEGTGVRRVNFLSTTRQASLLGTGRIHPLNDLLHEERITYLDSTGEFRLDHRFDEPVEILGLWLSADGDDTGSNFELVIHSITLETE